MTMIRFSLISLVLLGVWGGSLFAAQEQKVTVENFPRAESDAYLGALVAKGAFGQWDHSRDLADIDGQTIIRLNRDTLYSAAVFDLDAGPVTITLPDTGKRFISMQVINQDHYTVEVIYTPGSHTLTREKVGTRYFLAGIRMLVDPNDPEDMKKVHAFQDAITISQKEKGRFEVPKWEAASHAKVRDALITLADTLPDRNRMFGTRETTDPVRHLLGSASAWGGNPDKDAVYLNVFPEKNDGKSVYRLTVGEVPVDAFWSISVYNAKGYYEKNAEQRYTVNNVTAVRNDDGTITVQFGGKQGEAPNVLPVPAGWNYMVRLYRPRAEILEGRWEFPKAEPVAGEAAP